MFLSVIKQILIIFLLVATSSSISQRLIVENPVKSQRFIFVSGDRIKLKLDTFPNKIEGAIGGLSTKNLVINHKKISFSDIKKVILPNRLKVLRSLGVTLISTSTVFFSISGFVRLSNDQPFSDPNLWKVWSSLFGMGLVLTPFKDRHYKIRGNRRIRYLDF